MPETKFLLDQPAKVTWVDGMHAGEGGKLLPNNRSKDFSAARDAVKFVMETLHAGRNTAQIQTEAGPLHFADIERMYATLKSA